MAYFPFFMDIEGQNCLIAGGGAVACRKVEVLLEYGPFITVVSPVMSEGMVRLAEAAGASVDFEAEENAEASERSGAEENAEASERSGAAENAGAAESSGAAESAGASQSSGKNGSGGSLTLLCREYRESDLETADFVVAATADEALNHQISERCRAMRIPVNVVDVREECSFIFPALIRDGDITVGISTGGSSPTIAQFLKKRFREALPEGFGALAKQLRTYREMVKERVDSLPVRTLIFKEMVSLGVRQGCSFTREDAKRLIEQTLAGHGLEVPGPDVTRPDRKGQK